MAAPAPDPQHLTSWEDAFQHPLPIVRKLEHQLRQTISDNQQKLRSLVGASYRDLLGTAERIVEMDGQMQAVEANLGEIGRKCNARAVERAGENYVRMRRIREGGHVGRDGAMVQTKVVQSALKVISRTVKAGGDALLGAKLLVLARLLLKSVGDSSDAPDVLEELRRKLTVVRKRLVAYIERGLVRRATRDKASVVNPLCAYALVTSSTPKDVLRHFLQARYAQLETKAETATAESVMEMIGLYGQTLADTRDIFPGRFADGLAGIGKTPLLQDVQVRSTVELNLDIYDTWIAEDVRAFTPWLRHDRLTAAEVTEGLVSWSRQAQGCLLQSLGDCLEDQTDARVILEVRHRVLSMYLSLNSRVRDGADAQAVQKVREAFLDRLTGLAVAAAEVNATLSAHFERPSTSSDGGSMWELATEDRDLSDGAIGFRQAVIQQRHGHDRNIQRVLNELDAWLENLNRLWEIITEMSLTKWADELDDEEIEDLPDGETPQTAFNKRDPDLLRTRLRDAATAAFDRLYSKLQQASSTSPDVAVPSLRILRELNQRRRSQGDRVNPSENDIGTDDFIRDLHRTIAGRIVEDAVQRYTAAANKRSMVPVALWDGSPPLPVQPSPRIYKFLTALHKDMVGTGTDVWSPVAVGVVKTVLARRFPEALTEDVRTSMLVDDGGEEEREPKGDPGSTPVNGDATAVEDAKVLQTLFDALYLQRICITSNTAVDDGSPSGSLRAAIEHLRQRLTLDDTGYQRLRKSADEYWRRSYLLFGLLAS